MADLAGPCVAVITHEVFYRPLLVIDFSAIRCLRALD